MFNSRCMVLWFWSVETDWSVLVNVAVENTECVHVRETIREP